jgi:hypothetical protein
MAHWGLARRAKPTYFDACWPRLKVAATIGAMSIKWDSEAGCAKRAFIAADHRIFASLSPDPLQARAVHFEPLIGSLPVSVIQGIKPCVELSAVVHMANMRDLMCND